MKKPKFPKKKREPIIFEGIQYDSDFEVLFAQWVNEAISHGYIEESVYHPPSFVLCNGTARQYEVPGKRKSLVKSHALFGKIVYTADWWIWWTQKAIDRGLVGNLEGTTHMNGYALMYQLSEDGRPYTVIDVKPPKNAGGNNASYRDFGIKAPLIYDMFGIYVQSVVPIDAKKPDECFFSRCWAPKCYLERDRKDKKGYLMSYCKNINIEDYEKRYGGSR